MPHKILRRKYIYQFCRPFFSLLQGLRKTTHNNLPVGGGIAVLVALGPVVADGVRQGHAVAREGHGGDGPVDLGKGAQADLLVDVPDAVGAVGAGRGEEVGVGGRKCDGVDCVDVGLGALGGRGFAVAFEGEVGEAGSRVSNRMEELE